MKRKITNCPICQNLDLKFLEGYEKNFLIKCKKCSFVFDQRIPSSHELDEYYSNYAYNNLKQVSPQTINSFNKLLDFFEKNKGSGNILDLGCGQGDFLVEAKKRNWNIYGAEFSRSATELCEKRGIKMHQGELSKDMFEGIKFDVITSFEVIEHLNNPNEFMSVVYEKLHSKGIVYTTTPNFNSLLRFFEKGNFKMIAYPIHISFYSKKSIRKLGHINHFKAIKEKTTGIDIGRLINVFKPANKDIDAEVNKHFHIRKETTENVRRLADSSHIMNLLKSIINFLLSLFGIGDTLKVFWVKD
jgi:2-polyprenyl-3-methyl-5-hydroxy-6-metoxy-1,4-benzoquinol methylase